MELISGFVQTQIALDVKQKLLESWTKREIEHKRQEIHVSDLLYCNRQKVFERLSDDPQPMNDDFEYEKEIIWDRGRISIMAHPDAIWKQDHVIESGILDLGPSESSLISLIF
jgi:hypothetical protein